MKALFLILLSFLHYESIHINEGFHFFNSSVGFEIISQDTVKNSDFESQVVDSTKINKDSLEKIVPYLDDVKADTETGLIFLYMLLIIFSTFLSEDLACIGGGLMVANGLIEYWPAATAALMGIYTGDFTLYFAGRILGNSIFDIPPFKWLVKKEKIFSAEVWFQKRGPIILVLSRFIPGSRFPVYLSSGILKTSFWTFLLYFGLTALIWTPVLVWLSVFAGNEIWMFYESYENYAFWIILGVITFLILLIRYFLPAIKARFKI